MTTRSESLSTLWELRGAELARPDGALAGKSAVLLTGRDVDAAAHVAIGLGRAESSRRRVAIGDLVGDVDPLVALLDADDVHGIVDSFLYGVSINKVARPVSGSENLFVLPSGSVPVVTEEIFRSDRWRRLASGFREVGALLLLVAPMDAPGLDALAAMLDGVVSVGDDRGELATRFPLLAAVSERPPAPPVPERTSARRRTRGRPPVVLPNTAPTPARARMLVPLLVLLALAAGGGAAMWLRERRQVAVAPAPVRRDTMAAIAQPPAQDSLAIPLVPVNPVDSANAAAWAIDLAKYSSEEGARMAAQKITALPGATWFPMRLSQEPGVLWYRVVGGAWTDRATADSALAAITASTSLDLPASVVRAPLAILLRQQLGPDSLRVLTAQYAQAGLAPYSLRQDDGSYSLYAGAFETPDQSIFLALAVQKMGGIPTLVYRTGRAP